YESGAEAIKSVMTGDIDLVFLDINMPMLNGIEFARVIPQRTRIIYITAYEQYALQGFRVNALDYLLKPVNFAEFTRAVSKAVEWVAMRDSFENTSIRTNDDFLTIKADSRLIQMRTDSILYVEVQNDRVVFYRKDSDPVSSLISMKEIEELLPTDRFMRVHRSFIVNLSNIEIVERNRIVFGKTYIPIADSRRDDFFSRFTHH
ncbi:MAG: LytTR family DNA-binding domain-containing protein, partial [Muribaculaceae bacterium]|nr:LytTR family DNA-binding domain-containing protein [Muribaculaceae bacterium]